MSSRNFKLIPVRPDYVPSSKAQDQAIEVLEPFVEEAEVSLTVTTNVDFIHSGSLPSHITCSECSAPVDTGWWKETAENALQRPRLGGLKVKMPCCGKRVSLNDLNYGTPAGFARFMIEVTKASRDLEEQEIVDLEHRLRCPLRRIA